MALFKFFKTPSHQQFSYKPRYWDPKKEEAELRRERVELLQNGGVDAMKARISGGFRKGAGGAAAGTYRSQRVKRANGTLFMVIIALLIVSYFALEVYFPDLSKLLETEAPQELQIEAETTLPPASKDMEVEEL